MPVILVVTAAHTRLLIEGGYFRRKFSDKNVKQVTLNIRSKVVEALNN